MNVSQNNVWLAPEPDLLPDFIIGGAMKCGTSTLHAILDRHPKIALPKKELQFFDLDEIVEHGDFNFYNPKIRRWTSQRIETDPSRFWEWYHDKFRGLGTEIRGEDSTGYLGSVHAPKRIALQEKPIKMIFLLRHPTARAYSQYFHQLRKGRAIFSFEDSLRFDPYTILPRSLYVEKLKPWYDALPAERIGVWLFEDLIAKPMETVSEICNFLEVDRRPLTEQDMEMHKNPGRVPTFPGMQAFTNRLFRKHLANHYSDFLPNTDHQGKGAVPWQKVFTRSLAVVNPIRVGKPPLIKPETKEFLDGYFRNELQGLDALIGKKVTHKWFR